MLTGDEANELLSEEQSRGVAPAVMSLDDNPEQAGEAIRLAQATGTDASLIFPDVDAWKNQQKATVTKALFDENKFLRDYSASNPMAAKVSNDDWGNLDKLSETVGKLPLPMLPGASMGGTASVFARALEGFKHGFDWDRQQVEYAKLGEFLAETPGFGNLFIRHAAQATAGTAAAGLFGLSGLAAGAATGVGQVAENLGVPKAWADRLVRDAYVALNVAMPELAMGAPAHAAMVAGRRAAIADFGAKTSLYLAAGQTPPVGVHPVMDAIHAEQAKLDLANLQQALADSLTSTTRERSPDMFAGFIRGITDGDIGVSADAITALYGDKVPAPGDGLLGWVPRIQDQLSAAQATGGDVRIPIADWLAKVEPEVAKALEEHIRARPDGVSVAEAKAGSETAPREALPPTTPDGEALRAVKSQAGLPLDEREAFAKAAAMGMTEKQMELYNRRIAEQAADEAADAAKRALADERRRQTKEWKEEREKMRGQVVDEIRADPGFAADRLLREGRYLDSDLGRMRIGSEYLTPEQRKALPNTYYAKNGASPGELAAIVGLPDGPTFLAAVEAQVGARRQSGLRPDDFNRRMVDAELDRRMEAIHGKLDENIIEAAKERVLAETQMDMLHEETMALAAKAGLEFSITKEAYAEALRAEFGKLTMKEVSSDRFLASAGKAAREMEMGHLKNDPHAAYLQKQKQYNSLQMAKFAKEIENQKAQLDKLAKRYEGREVKGVDPATRYYVQALLQEAGYKVKLTPDEIANEIGAYGHGPLSNFVEGKFADGHEPSVPDWLMNDGPRAIESLTTAEFSGFKDAIDTLNEIGRGIEKIIVAGEARDFAAWKRDQVLPLLEQRPVRKLREGPGEARNNSWLYGLDSMFSRPEAIIRALDQMKELGPLFKALIVPMELAKAKSYELLTDLSKKIDGLNKDLGDKWYKSLEDSIPNNFIIDTYYGAPFELTRWNMVKMMMNWGNKENALKLVDGIARAELPPGIKPAPEHLAMIEAKVQAMIDTHAKAEDWKFVQFMWDQFDSYRPEIEKLQRNMGGKPPKWVEGREVVTPFGNLQGKYFPLILDKARNVGQKVDFPVTLEGLLGKDYHRATTDQYHLAERTGAKYFVDITNGPEQIIGRLQQVIHDLSFRDAVVQANKILSDPDLASAIRKHYGPEYLTQLKKWNEDVARANNTSDDWLAAANGVLGRARMNLVMSALPLNPSVMLTPSLGTANPRILLTALQSMTNWAMGKTSKVQDIAMAHSKEIPNLLFSLDRDAAEAMARVTKTGTWSSWQKWAMEKFYTPLVKMEQQTRMTTFYTAFMREKELGRTDFEAGIVADSAVRRHHGVSHFSDLSTIMRSKNEFIRVPTIFMGYFSTIFNWQREVPDLIRQGRTSDAVKALWGVYGVATLYNYAMFTKQKQDEPWYKHMARSVVSTPFSMIPYVREGWGCATEGFQPRSPLTSFFMAGVNVARDVGKMASGERPKRPVRNAAELIGGGLGIPGALQAGRWGEFAYDLKTGEQRPKNIIEWWRGILWGDSQLRK